MRPVWTTLLLIYTPSSRAEYGTRCDSGRADSPSPGNQCGLYGCVVRHYSGKAVQCAGSPHPVPRTSRIKILLVILSTVDATLREDNCMGGFCQVFSGRDSAGKPL